MLQAADAVVFLVKQLRGGTNIERIREANDRLQFAEGEADKVMLQLLKELYQTPCDPRELVILHDLYEMVEQAVDRCRNAGNVVVRCSWRSRIRVCAAGGTRRWRDASAPPAG